MTKENEDVEASFANKSKAQCTYRCVSGWADKETGNHATTLKDPEAKTAGSVLHPPNEISREKIPAEVQKTLDHYFRRVARKKVPRSHENLICEQYFITDFKIKNK